jgi:ABC-type branched-subunit amino acid transport system ATPase component
VDKSSSRSGPGPGLVLGWIRAGDREDRARGSVLFKGRDISHFPPKRRALTGLGWVPQEREIFPSLTVEENLTVAGRSGRWNLEAVYGLFPRLKERRANMGKATSFMAANRRCWQSRAL